MFQRTGFASGSITFVIENIIRCYNDDQNSNNIIFESNLGNGIITNIENSGVSISWDSDSSVIIKYTDISDFANFNYNSYKVCVKIGDFWEDKDSNRYNDAGIRQ